MRVMGIDPGLSRLGFGVVDEGPGDLASQAGGTISTSPSAAVADRLVLIFDHLTELFEQHRPEVVAVERIFLKLNQRTAVPALRASGVALLAAAKWGAEVFEYSPLEVKQAVVGTGSATKDQVRYMVQRLLKMAEPPGGPDAADALATAICHINSYKIRSLEAVR